MLEQSLTLLAPGAGSTVVDATLGGGGHAAAILERSAPSGRVIGLDVDAAALQAAAQQLACFGERILLQRASFRELSDVLAERGIQRVDAVLMDLGVSSHQLDTPERGFRFGEDTSTATPLDMRMDSRSAQSAAQLLARASELALEKIFREYGELPGARRLARCIVEEREHHPIRSSADLLQVIRKARVGGGRRHHPATLVFQALRIAVNDELQALADGLDAAIAALRTGGRLVVISYHSLEDRLVKHKFRAEARGCICPPQFPRCACGRHPRLRVLTPRPVAPDAREVFENPRARSAHLRAAERLEEPQ